MANLQDLPPELIAMITADLDFGSHMSLMLASKTLFGMMPEVWATRPQVWIDFNLNFEQHVPAGRVLPILTCTQCARFHPRAKFSDAQRRKTCPNRFCIETGIQHNKYLGARRTFRVGGVLMFGCAGCYKAWPEREEASYGGQDHSFESLRWCKGCWKAIATYLRSEDKTSSTDILIIERARWALMIRREITADQYRNVKPEIKEYVSRRVTGLVITVRCCEGAENAYWKLSLR